MAEKSLSDLPRDLRMLFTKGNEALQRDNFDYAIDLFNQVLAKEPAVYECRKALRTAQMRRRPAGQRFLQEDAEQRQLVAAARQGPHGFGQRSRPRP